VVVECVCMTEKKAWVEIGSDALSFPYDEQLNCDMPVVRVENEPCKPVYSHVLIERKELDVTDEDFNLE